MNGRSFSELVEASYPYDFEQAHSGSVSTISSDTSWSFNPPMQTYQLNTNWYDSSTFITSTPASPYNNTSPPMDTLGGFDAEYFLKEDKQTEPPRKQPTPAVLSRRRAQNRASQRAYRDRKDRRAKDLEDQLEEMTQQNEKVTDEYARLNAEYLELKKEEQKWKELSEAEKKCCRGGVGKSTGSSSEGGGVEKEPGITVKVVICKNSPGECPDINATAAIENK